MVIFENLIGIIIDSHLYAKVVVVSKVPLPNYRFDLDDRRPQREVCSHNSNSIIFSISSQHCFNFKFALNTVIFVLFLCHYYLCKSARWSAICLIDMISSIILPVIFKVLSFHLKKFSRSFKFLRILQVTLPLGLLRRVEAHVSEFSSQKSRTNQSFSDVSFSRSSSNCSLATDDGLFEAPEPLASTKVVMDKVHWRRSMQLRDQQRSWQVFLLLLSFSVSFARYSFFRDSLFHLDIRILLVASFCLHFIDWLNSRKKREPGRILISWSRTSWYARFLRLLIFKA